MKRRLHFKLEPSPLSVFYDWRVYRDCVPNSLRLPVAGFTIGKDLTIENCSFLGTEVGNYIEERKDKFLMALRKAWDNDELTFTVEL